MPKLWNDTVEQHRRTVHEAILDATAALVSENGLTAVTMSAIAERTGIGRATLYKYFPDVESILWAWHDRQVARHLEELTDARDHNLDPRTRLQTVLTAYALGQQQSHDSKISAMLHQGEQGQRAHQRLRAFVRELIAQGAATGDLRSDVPADELTDYCLHALGAAATLPSQAAAHRLVNVTTAGLRPPLE